MNCKTCRYWRKYEIVAVAFDHDGPMKDFGRCYKIAKDTEENFGCVLYKATEVKQEAENETPNQ